MEKFKVDNYELDEMQMKILNSETNTLVIAGAGCGKTLTILGKINYLIENNNCNPENILVISFTNASVNDIKNRVTHNVNLFTFHKLAIHLLDKSNFYYKIASTTLLNYIIEETIKTCSKKEQKIILKFLKLNINFTHFLKTNEYESFCKLILTFINLYKANCMKYEDFICKKFSKLEKEIIIFILKIYKMYNLEKRSSQLLDFDDLIIYAAKIVKEIKLNYKYIIIDEFQDTSVIRLNLIKEIYKYTKAKIIVVGDDWQSIYHFSGCNLNIFLEFDKYFPHVLKINLTNTYRNSQQLINVATKFIQKNPLQIPKKLISLKLNKNPIIFAPYTSQKTILKRILNTLLLKSTNIMILSRNNKDIYNYIDSDFSITNNTLTYKNWSIKHYTIHKSKGLETDYTIILNCNDEILGFPNKLEDNSIVSKMFSNSEIKYAEERRLFYVALTRCKIETYIVYDKYNPSIFVKEIKKIVKNELHYFKYFKD